PDCRCCQWCADERCRLCLKSTEGCRKKLSMAEQIALFEQINTGRHSSHAVCVAPPRRGPREK
ncbi:MAG: hypothetical protein P8Y91_04720, partial [Desulfuromonadales bacterium]